MRTAVLSTDIARGGMGRRVGALVFVAIFAATSVCASQKGQSHFVRGVFASHKGQSHFARGVFASQNQPSNSVPRVFSATKSQAAPGPGLKHRTNANGNSGSTLCRKVLSQAGFGTTDIFAGNLRSALGYCRFLVLVLVLEIVLETIGFPDRQRCEFDCDYEHRFAEHEHDAERELRGGELVARVEGCA